MENAEADCPVPVSLRSFPLLGIEDGECVDLHQEKEVALSELSLYMKP